MANIICPWTALYLSYLLTPRIYFYFYFFVVKALLAIVENKNGTDENTLQCIFQ